MKKIKIGSFLLCFICVLFSTCTRDIRSLDKQKVHFDELPLLVQDTLIALAEQGNRSLAFIFLEKDRRYETKLLETGPFIDGYTFKNMDKRRKYKVSNGVPKPYILYDNFLYHPINFNLFSVYRKNLRDEMFMRYALK